MCVCVCVGVCVYMCVYVCGVVVVILASRAPADASHVQEGEVPKVHAIICLSSLIARSIQPFRQLILIVPCVRL